MIRKKNVLLKITEIMAWDKRGGDWINYFAELVSNVIFQGALVKIWFPAIPNNLLIGAMVSYWFLRKLLNIVIGWIDFKKGIWKIQSEWGQKTEQIAPWNVEAQNTLKAICKKLEIKDHFNDIK